MFLPIAQVVDELKRFQHVLLRYHYIFANTSHQQVLAFPMVPADLRWLGRHLSNL